MAKINVRTDALFNSNTLFVHDLYVYATLQEPNKFGIGTKIAKVVAINDGSVTIKGRTEDLEYAKEVIAVEKDVKTFKAPPYHMYMAYMREYLYNMENHTDAPDGTILDLDKCFVIALPTGSTGMFISTEDLDPEDYDAIRKWIVNRQNMTNS